MLKRKSVIIISMILGLLLAGFIFLLHVRGEFKSYLSEKYPEQIFNIGFVKIDPIYGNYIANVTCLDDYVSFPISKSFYIKSIHEDYSQSKSQIQYNSKIRDVFYGSDIKGSIINVTGGGGKTLYQNDGYFSQINLHVTTDAELISVTKRTLAVLRENHIDADTIILMQEKGGHIYELKVSSIDYNLTEKELSDKMRMIK
jgi:hypothetical protein